MRIFTLPILCLLITSFGGFTAIAEQSPQAFSDVASQNTQSLSFVRLDYASTQEVPHEIRSALAEALQTPQYKKIPVSIYFSLTNDLNFLEIVGVQAKTDDFGYTHGTEFKIIGDLPGNYTLALSYSTDLYTHPVSGALYKSDKATNHVKQYFTDENILKMIVTHKAENKAYFWKAEAGWIELSSIYRKRFLNASTQQDLFHDSVNSIQGGDTTKNPDFVNSTSGDQNGLLVGIYMGLAKTYFKDTDRCEKSAQIQTGFRTTTLSNTDLRSLEAQLAADCNLPFTRNRFRMETGYQVIGHDDGTQRQYYFDFSTKRTNWKVGFRVEQNSGDLINYMNYNLPNVDDGTIDPIFRIYTQRDL